MTHHKIRFHHIALTCALIVGSAYQAFALSWAQSYGLDSYDIHGAPAQDPFGCSGYDAPIAIAKMPDGGFVVAGYLAMPSVWAKSGTYGQRGNLTGLVRYAPDGTILWQTLLHQDNDTTYNGELYTALNQVGQIATDAQGNIFVVGTKQGNGWTSNFARAFIAKFSPDGVLLWENGFNGGSALIGNPPQQVPIGSGGASYLGLTNDGGVLITLSQSRPENSYTIPVLAKFDSNGVLVFERAYENPTQYRGTTPVCQSKDSSRYVMAFEYHSGVFPESSRYGLLLVVTDTAGNIVGQYGYDHSEASPNETPVVIIATQDGGFATLSKLYDDPGFIVRKLSSDLSTEVFEKRVTSSSSGYLPGNSLTETSDGGFLIGGAGNKPSQPTDVIMWKLSSTGNLVFASILGGPRYEGYPVLQYAYGTSIATELVGGGYGFAATSPSYHVGGPVSISYNLPDWWVAKTDTNRQIRNFHDTMENLPLDYFTVTGSPEIGATLAIFSDPGYPNGLGTSDLPHFVLQDLGANSLPDLPTLMIQASSPRIISNNKAEAIVEQHFWFQVRTAFFPDSSQVTYSASGMPQHFEIDPQTGLISGITHVGDETVENNLPPIPITLHATDGTDTADATLYLAISDGKPFLTVNGSSEPVYPNPSATPVPNLNDKTLTFEVKQAGKATGRVMTMLATTDPGNGSSWQPLGNGNDGVMAYDVGNSGYVLGSTDYPLAGGVYFRSRLRAPGRADVFSNVVGPFDLTPMKSRIGTTKLFISRNGLVCNIRFGVTEQNTPPGIGVRIQTTKTPALEGSWTDVANGTMAQDPNKPTEFYVGFDDYPAGDGNFFRAIASVSNFADSISALQGPFTFIYDPAATVTTTIPHNGSNDGTDYDLPIEPISSSFNVTANAQSGRTLKRLALFYDGDRIDKIDNGGTNLTTLYTTTTVGDHLIEARAIDDLGIVGYSKPVHLRVSPPAPGKTYFILQEGNWHNPAIWIDSQGNHGVPGPHDFAVLGSVNVHVTQPVEVKALSLNGGTMDGSKLTITGFCTIGDGQIANDLDIASGATMLLINDADVGFSGTATNYGVVKFHGKAGLKGVPNGTAYPNRYGTIDGGAGEALGRFLNWISGGRIQFHPAAGGRQGSKSAPTPTPSPSPASITTAAPEVKHVALESVVNKAGKVDVISNDGNSVVSNDGNSVISNDGNSLIGNGGGGLVDPHGNPIVSQGAGNAVAEANSLIGEHGAGLVTDNGSGIVSQGAGNAIAQAGAQIVATGAGNIVSQGAGNIISTNGGATRPFSSRKGPSVGTTLPGYQQDGGETDMNGLTIIGPVTLNGGVISGTGAIIGDVNNVGGTIAPGHSAGALAITGNFSQGTNGTVMLEAEGGRPQQFDQIQVGATATLAGTLHFQTFDSYTPLPDDPFNPLGYNAVSGNFEHTSSNSQVTLNGTGMQVVLAPNPAPAAPTANAGSNVTGYSFVANWSSSNGASGYQLDVSTDEAFSSYVPGFQNRNVGNLTSYLLKGLAPNTSYFYRVRAYITDSTSANSSTISVSTLSGNPTPTPTPKPRATPGLTPTPTPRPSSTPKP